MSAGALAKFVSLMHPNFDSWPFVTVPAFENISSILLDLSSGSDMLLFPFVLPEQALKFETFAYDYYENKRDPPFPKGTAVNSFGKGVWAVDPKPDAPDMKYHDNGTTSWGSPNQVLSPLLHFDSGPDLFLMFNIHSEETRGRALDRMIECAKTITSPSNMEDKCGIVTDMMYALEVTDREPAAGIGAPIFPANDPMKLAGIVGTIIVWDELLQNVFAEEVSGIDCVLETESQAHTYTIVNGVPLSRGKGDFHQPRYDRLRQSAVVTGNELFTETSPKYKLSIYPNDELYNVYSTNNLMVATVRAVCIMVFTTFLFFLYDFIVRREFNAKQELLVAKHRFMRYVSHEVRTPLNAFCMGLAVMQKEIAASLRRGSVQEIQQDLDEDRLSMSEKSASVPDIEALEWFSLTSDVLNNAQGAVDVLSELLNYDKVETGTLHLELTVIPVWHLVQRTVEDFMLPASKKSLSFEVSFSAQVPEQDPCLVCSADDLSTDMLARVVVGDSVRLTQVFRNLISNAIKFSQEGGSVHVQASWIGDSLENGDGCSFETFELKNGREVTCQQSGKLKVIVQDNGAGMTEEQVDQLFHAGVQFNVNDCKVAAAAV